MNVAERTQNSNVKPLRGRVLNVDIDAVRREDAIKAEAWLKDRVADAALSPVSEIVMLTPGLATALLARNEKNRKVSETNLSRIKRDIETGNWQFNGASIVLSKDGRLNDGQHRCRAVIETNMPIKVVVVFGLDRESRMTLDQGAVRSVGNFLSMHGLSNVNMLAATASLVWQWKRHGFVSTSPEARPTKTEVRILAETDSQVAESASFCDIKGARSVATPSMLAFAHYAYRSAADVIEADAFIRALVSGAGLKVGDPILYCRNRLIETKSRSNISERAELLFKTWNAHRRGERIERITVTGRALPKLEG